MFTQAKTMGQLSLKYSEVFIINSLTQALSKTVIRDKTNIVNILETEPKKKKTEK